VPALVAVGAEVAKELLKDILSKGKDGIIRLVGVRVRSDLAETHKAKDDLHARLMPLGFSEEEIDEICTKLTDQIHDKRLERPRGGQ
jgi:Holliday junction resolvasome RuvABC DNA-binding subunit